MQRCRRVGRFSLFGWLSSSRLPLDSTRTVQAQNVGRVTARYRRYIGSPRPLPFQPQSDHWRLSSQNCSPFVSVGHPLVFATSRKLCARRTLPCNNHGTQPWSTSPHRWGAYLSPPGQRAFFLEAVNHGHNHGRSTAVHGHTWPHFATRKPRKLLQLLESEADRKLFERT